MSFSSKKLQFQQRKPRRHQQQKKQHKSSNKKFLPTTYITAQNCFSNFVETTKVQTNESRETTLMIKNIDTTASTSTSANTQQTDCDEKKEEEKNDLNVKIERRNSSNAEDTSSRKSSCCDQPVISKHRIDSLTLQEVSPTNVTISSNDEKEFIDLKNSTEIYYNSNFTLNTAATNNSNNTSDLETGTTKSRRTPSPSGGGVIAEDSPTRRKDSTDSKTKIQGSKNSFNISTSDPRCDEADTFSKSSDTSGEFIKLQPSTLQESSIFEKCKSTSRISERAKKKSWYNVLYPNYKSRAEDFKKLFKDVPNDERLIVDYSCALQRDILVQGRLYVSQNYVCFHANIFRWETYLCIKWKDVTSITKEKTALVIPNAISICTAKEKYFFATFATRDKAFLMLFRVWQNTLLKKQMLPIEMWQYVHDCYGEELGLTSDDEDYIDPTSVPNETEGELEFNSALEDTASINSSSQFTAALANESNSLIFPSSGSSSNSSCGISTQPPLPPLPINKKSKKSYFFSSNKSSSNSANATSGSDNKASDNNSGGGDLKKSNNMKPYAKELTLISAEPDENIEGEAAQNLNTKNDITTDVSAKETKSATHDGKRKVSKNTRQRDESLCKNTEAIPTDMSDSSDSEENQIPFIVTAECNSTHEGRQIVHTILPINIETLFNLLFSKSKFLVDFHAMRKSTDTNFPDWVTNEHGQKTRTVNVTVQLAASVGPKSARVTEYQVMRDCSKPGELYSIDINSVNAGIPYGDSFSVVLHYCLVRTVDDHTMLSVHAQIKYKKSIWGMVKGFIEKNTWIGLEDFYRALLHALQSETCIPPAKGKGRRPRRANAAQVRTIDENAVTAITQAKTLSAEHLSATHALHLPHAHASTSQTLSGETSTSKYKWLSLFVIVLLLFLIVVNVILLLKLWKLEVRIEEEMSSRARIPNLSSLKQLPNSHQEWMELLRQQEILHETELRKWHQVLQTAIELLKKTEKTLAELMFR